MKKIFLMTLAVVLLVAGACNRHKTPVRIPEVSGHRGANCIAPENTLASADSCIKYGIPGME